MDDSPSTSRTPASDDGSNRLRLGVALAISAAAALVEWGLAGAGGGFVGWIGPTTGFLLSLGQWCLFGTAAGFGWSLAAAAVGRPRAERDIADRVVAWGTRILRQRGRAADRRRLASVAGAVLGSTLLIAGSVALFARLIANRHGPVLIALAGVVGQVLLAVAAVIVAATTSHWLRRLLLALDERGWLPDWVSTATFLAGGLLVAAAVSVGALIRYWPTFLAVAGPSIALPAVVVAGIPVGTALLTRRWQPSAAVWAAPAVGVALILVGAQFASSRLLIQRESLTSKYFFTTLKSAGDFDGDGSSAFPTGDDCRPFDPTIHPYATEIPDNGRDENCDGADTRPDFERPEPHDYLRPDGPKPNLVLVTFDALRADHLGFLGYDRDTSPRLDAVADQSIVFERAFSQDSGTGPSMWSLMTGRTPFQVDLEYSGFPPKVGEDETLLGEALADAGYRTEAWLCGNMLHKERWNIRRGFDKYETACEDQNEDPAPETAEKAQSALERLAKRDEPFFLWVHFYDPHHPYDRHDLVDFGDDEIDRYDEEIRYADKHFGQLFDAIRKLKDDRPLHLAVGADHGENFGTHGNAPHARTLYREVTHVPMLLWSSGRVDVEPRRIDVPVALNDLYPTLLELARTPIPDDVTMISQTPLLFGAPPYRDRIVYQENSYSRPRHHRKGAITGDYHYIRDLTADTEELYNYVDDPDEQENLAGTGLPVERRLRRAVDSFLQTSTIPDEIKD